jgi:putative transposase
MNDAKNAMHDTSPVPILDGGALEPDALASELETLRALQSQGRLPASLITALARKAGVSEKTIRRRLKDGKPLGRKRERYRASEEDILALYETGGDVSKAHRLLKARTPESCPHLKTYERAIKAAIPAAELRAIRDGERGFEEVMPVLLNPDGDLPRNHLWEIDIVELPQRAHLPRHTHPRKTYGVVVIDGGSRKVVGWGLVFGRRPNRGDVLDVLAEAIREHGVPHLLRCDNAPEFLAADVVGALAHLNTLPAPTAPYAPRQKGKVERVIQTLSNAVAVELGPGVDGPRLKNGTLVDGETPAFSPDLLRATFAGAVDSYNHEHRHRMLGGRTPQDAWDADPTPLRTVDPVALAHIMQASTTRKLTRFGIQLDNDFFIAPDEPRFWELQGTVVEVRYSPNDRRRVEVFDRAGWAFTAINQRELTGEDKRAFLELRKEHKDRAMKRLAKTARRRKARRVEAERQLVATQGRAPEAVLAPNQAKVEGDRRIECDLDRAHNASTSLISPSLDERRRKVIEALDAASEERRAA